MMQIATQLLKSREIKHYSYLEKKTGNCIADKENARLSFNK